MELQDSYKSILESFIHAGAENEVRVKVEYIHSEHINEKTIGKKLSKLDGILVAPGFGERGVKGKVAAVQYADPVISIMEDQKNITEMGGTMRLGSWKCEIKDGTLASKIYKSKVIAERHRHRYEFNSEYREQFEAAGLIASGINPDTGLVEIIEIPSHPWFVGVQYHPEYKSTVASPHPLFVAFVKAVNEHAIKKK